MLNIEALAIETPAMVFDQQRLENNLQSLLDLKQASGCKLLYSIKALSLSKVLQIALPYVDGFSVSSLFEARLARQIMAGKGEIHLTTPGLRENECDELSRLCTHISFNSLSQQERMEKDLQGVSLGLRVNPKMSFLDDERYDPCRLGSKLGIDIHQLERQVLNDDIEGLHCHNVFSVIDTVPLLRTVERLQRLLSKNAAQLKWINLGGGYLFPKIKKKQTFIQLVRQLRRDFDLDVYIEPGKAVVNDAGFMITKVIDCFVSDEKMLAILDSSVNHHPEIFEYQKSPDLYYPETGEKKVMLVGSSCLAGDIFGEYFFRKEPKIGDRIIFCNVGAYSLVKANRFNGYALPDVYWLDGNNHCDLISSDEYSYFLGYWRQLPYN